MLKINNKEYGLALNFICRDEEDTLLKMLESIQDVGFDEVICGWTGSNPKTKEILDKFKVAVYKFDWVNDFSKARNFVKDKTKSEYIMWLDSDDILQKGHLIKKVCEAEFSKDSMLGAIWFRYDYDFDKDGNCVMQFWRERVVRKDWFDWRGALHETLIQKHLCHHCLETDISIKHNTTTERIQDGAMRNLNIIIAKYKEEIGKGAVDPRVIYDLARSLAAIGHKTEAITKYFDFIRQTGNDDDRFEAYIRMGKIYRDQRFYGEARRADLMAQGLRPTWPDSYLGLAQTAYCEEKWDEVITYTELASLLKPPVGIMPIDPMEYEAKPLLWLQRALCMKSYVKPGNEAKSLINRAYEIAQKALRFYPSNQWLKDCIGSMEEAQKHLLIEEAALAVVEWMKENKKSENIPKFIDLLPDIDRTHPSLVRIKNEYSAKSSSNRIVIMCGPTAEPWSPLTAKTGVGGSEEAVIHLAQELTKLGWIVDVYNECEKAGNFDGVNYNYWESYDKKAPCAIFIGWRLNEFVDVAPENAYKVLWLHDVQKEEWYAPMRTVKINKLFVLSKWHRTTVDWIPDNQVLITANGIDPSHFNIGLSRNPLKCIYASSPDRGLDCLLDMWPKIREKVPEATLHIFYGFTRTYDKCHENDIRWKQMKERILKKLNQPGIFYRGMIGHKDLANEFLTSGTWLYPTEFTEISCITAMKIQAAGVIPVCTNVAALDETVQYGIKINCSDIYTNIEKQKKFIEATVYSLTNGFNREEMIKWAKEKFSWQNVAKKWDVFFREALVCENSSSQI